MILFIFDFQCDIPVTTTLHGMGIVSELHPLSLHMHGMHGSPYANLAIQSADLIISIGARFGKFVFV